MKQKNKILSALEDAYKANRGITVTAIEDCRRKVVVNNAIEYVCEILRKEQEEETKSVEKEEADDKSTGERGQAVSE